ncbi:MAG: inner-membrane translocator [Frankiales bacterium]|nr:MAG: inner-membrane translocator [Frankiales bacterium]
MSQFLAFTIIGLIAGSAYAVAASGLVLTYATSNVFNIAHGSVGMFMAFVYWELAVDRGLPPLLALVLVVGVLAPLFGLLIERFMMRKLTDAPVAVALVVTVALLVALIGAAQALWPPAGRKVDPYFNGRGLQVGDYFITAQQLITFGVAVAVAAALFVLLNRTRTGTAMRAVVDNRELLALHGARPNRLSGLSWAIGCSLAALAGVLLVPTLQLDYLNLTLLVIAAYAAAMVGRLKNLPRTFVGALVLGLLTSYAQWGVAYIPASVDQTLGGLVQGTRIALPTIFLLAVMLMLPQDKLRVGRVAGTKMPALPSWSRTLTWGAVFLAGVFVLTGSLSEADNSRFGQALCISLIMLSLVLLVGYGGDVSLCQMSFVGVGGLVVGGKLLPFVDAGITVWSIAWAFLATALLGVLVAVPALRLRGLYLGLATLAVASALDSMLFQTKFGFGAGGGSLTLERGSLLGLDLTGERAMAMSVAVAFVLMGFLVLGVRRSRYGRILLAARDSEAACATLGYNTRAVRVAVFAVSAGLAGVAGVFYTGMRVSISTADFMFFQSLPLLLFAVVGGVTTVTGVLLGGLAYGLMPVLLDQVPALAGVIYVLLLLAVLGLGGNPNGVAQLLFGWGNRLRAALPRQLDLARIEKGEVVGAS